MRKIVMRFFLVTIVFICATDANAAEECPSDQLGVPTLSIEVDLENYQLNREPISNRNILLETLKGASRECSVSIRATTNSSIEVAQELCQEIQKVGFNNIVLVPPDSNGWTLYPPGVHCSVKEDN